MDKKAFFYIDDVIWVLRDITREKTNSVFDNPFLGILKRAHDMYGLKVQLNLFNRTDFFYGSDEFTLSDVTDRYGNEWKENSDWLKFSFHAKQEFPDYPYINADYKDVKSDYDYMAENVKRFASEENLGKTVVPHWTVMSRDGAKALADCGVKILSFTNGSEPAEYSGNPSDLPYGHAARCLQNRKPETKIYVRQTKDTAISRALCGYNNLPSDVASLHIGTLKPYKDEKTGINLFSLCNTPALNLLKVGDIPDAFDKVLGSLYVGTMIHEQYFYKDYYQYQPDYDEKILTAAQILYQNGYTFFFPHELCN